MKFKSNTSSEVKPRFAVGDKVIVINPVHSTKFLDKIGTITEVLDSKEPFYRVFYEENLYHIPTLNYNLYYEKHLTLASKLHKALS